MKGLERLTWNGFLGINTKTDPYDVKDTHAIEATNIKLSRSVGKIVKCPGYATAQLRGVDFSASGLGGRTINQLGELVTSHQDADSPYFVCQAGTDNKFYYWDYGNAQWTEISVSTTVDTSVIKFLPRPSGVLALCGSGSANYPVLIQFAPEQFTYGYDDPTKTKTAISSGLIGDTTALLTPDDVSMVSAVADDINNAAWSNNDGFETDTKVAYRLAFQFDGYQYGPPGDTVYQITASGLANESYISFSFGFLAASFPQRITGVKVYRCENYRADSGVDKFRLLRTIGMNDDIKWRGKFQSHKDGTIYNAKIQTHVQPGAQASYDGALQFTMAGSYDFGSHGGDLLILGVKTSSFDETDLEGVDASFFDYLMPISGTDETGGSHVNVLEDGGAGAGTYYLCLLDGWYLYGGYYRFGIYDTHTYLENEPEMYADLGYVQDETSNLNYEVAAMVNRRQYVARYWDGEKTIKNAVRVSSISNDATYDYDVYHAEDVIPVQEHGITEIIGLGKWRDSLIVFGKEDILIVFMDTTNPLSWRVFDTIQRVGLAAARSLVMAMGDTYYINNNGPYRFRESSSALLPEIVDPDNWPLNVTTLSECVGVLDNNRDEVWLSFPTDKVVFCRDLINGQWTKYSLPIGADILLRANDDTLYIGDGTDLYQMDYDESKFGSTGIVPVYKSKELKFQDHLIMPYAFEIRYNSDTAFTVKVYLDGVLWLTRTIASGDTEELQKLLAASPCNKIQYEITMTSAQAASNTTFEIRSFTLSYKAVARV